jgi:hypothetical protein
MEVSRRFMPWPLYTWEKSPLYPSDRKLGGPQNQSGPCEEEKNLLPGIELWQINKFNSPEPFRILTLLVE